MHGRARFGGSIPACSPHNGAAPPSGHIQVASHVRVAYPSLVWPWGTTPTSDPSTARSKKLAQAGRTLTRWRVGLLCPPRGERGRVLALASDDSAWVGTGGEMAATELQGPPAQARRPGFGPEFVPPRKRMMFRREAPLSGRSRRRERFGLQERGSGSGRWTWCPPPAGAGIQSGLSRGTARSSAVGPGPGAEQAAAIGGRAAPASPC